MARAEQTGMFRISDVRSDRLSLCRLETKRNVGGKRNQATSHFVLSVQSKLLKRNRCVARAGKLMLQPSSILPLSINVGLKEISRSKQRGAEDEGADLTDDISVDISTSAAFQYSPSI